MSDIEQLPAKANISFVRGDDFTLDVEVQDDDGNPIDLSVWSNIKLQVRELEKNGGTLLKEYTTSGSLSVTSGGRVQVTFASSDTSTWSESFVEYEMEGSDSNGDNRSIIRGQINIVKEISE
jgi:hypothetical protein